MMERHFSETHTIRLEIYYAHPQSDRTRQTAAGRPIVAAVFSGENLRTNIDR